MSAKYRYHWGMMGWASAMGLLMAPAVMAHELGWVRGTRQAESRGEWIPEVVPQQLYCQDEPSGFGLPGFKPGTLKPQVERLIGAPAAVQRGYWGNSTALVYYLIPNQVSLGLLFDDKSDVLQQTEASFHHGLELPLVLSTLDSMLGCQLNEAIEGAFTASGNGKPRSTASNSRPWRELSFGKVTPTFILECGNKAFNRLQET